MARSSSQPAVAEWEQQSRETGAGLPGDSGGGDGALEPLLSIYCKPGSELHFTYFSLQDWYCYPYCTVENLRLWGGLVSCPSSLCKKQNWTLKLSVCLMSQPKRCAPPTLGG